MKTCFYCGKETDNPQEIVKQIDGKFVYKSACPKCFDDRFND